MPDDLLTTVKARQRTRHELGIGNGGSPYDETVREIDALLARCEAAEGCDGNCSCVVMSRHEWQRAYSEERLKREAAEAERDALRLMNDPERGEKQALIARLVKAESELAAARAEVARLREARADDVALVARLSHQVVALRDAITRVLDGPHYIDRDYQDVLLAALDTPAREGA